MDFNELKFVRINNTTPEVTQMLFNKIPRGLFDQIKDIDFNVDLLYRMPEKFISGFNTRFYVLADKDDEVKGILWAFINILTESIDVQVLSVDKQYQWSNALNKTLEFIKSWQGENESLKVKCITTRPQAYKKAGWKESRQKIMETT